MPLESSVNYYADLLASQFRNKSKARAHVRLFTKQMLGDMLAADINPAYDIDTAVGGQLNTIGKYVGAPRDVGVEDTRPYLGFVTYDYPAGTQNLNGFKTYASLATNDNAQWYEYEFTNKSVSQLPDYSYRQLIKLKVGTNLSNNSMSSVQDLIQTFFPGQLQLKDNNDMSMTYFFGGSFQLPVSVLETYLPRPMGVRVEAVQAIAFDVLVDSVPAFNSETPNPAVDFGAVQFSSAKVFTITNVKTASITIQTVTTSNPVFLFVGASPTLPVTLAQGESADFTIVASSTAPVDIDDANIAVYLASAQGAAVFRINASVEIEGVFLDWIAFDNFVGYTDGTLDSPWDSWGWAAAGTTVSVLLAWTRDSFTSYTDGALDAPNAGTDWAAAGVTTYYVNT